MVLYGYGNDLGKELSHTLGLLHGLKQNHYMCRHALAREGHDSAFYQELLNRFSKRFGTMPLLHEHLA